MTEKRYSLIVVLLSIGVVFGIAVVSLSGGLFLGYHWGKSAGRAQALAELPRAGAETIGPLLDQLLPRERFPGGERPDFGVPIQPFLGISFREITPELIEQEGLADEHGALVTQVVPGSPAESAGLQPGDIIHRVGHTEVNHDHPLTELISAHRPGDQVELSVIRDGRRITVEVELGARPTGRFLESGLLDETFPFLGEGLPGFQFEGEFPQLDFQIQCEPEPCPFFED